MRADGFINLALERTKARVKTNDLVTGLLGLLATVLAYLLAVVVVDQSIHLGHSTRIWLLAILGLVVAVGLAAILLWPTIRRVNDLFAARLIERQAEDLFRNSLVTFVQVRGDDTVPRDVRGAIEAKAARDLSAIDVELAVNRRPLRFAVAALLVAGALMLVFALASSKSFTVSMSRALGSTAVAPTATRIVQVRTDPEGPGVMAGTDLRVVVITADREPESVVLRMTRGGTYQDVASMKPLDQRTWEFVIENLLQNLKFNVQAGDARSRTYAIAVRPLPEISDVQTVLTFPAYTLLQPQSHDSGQVEALIGTRVEVIARMNQEPRRPELIFGDGGRRQPMRTSGNSHRARAEFTVSAPDSYHVHFLDKSLKYNNAGAIEYQVTPLADQAPGVELDRSGSEVRLAEGGRLPLVVCATDDYGLDRLTVRWRTVRPGNGSDSNGGRAGKVRSIELQKVPAGQAVLRIEDRFTVELSKMGLRRGDQALVWVRATDRLPGGGQEGQSPPLRVVVVPPEKAPTAGGGGQSQTEQPQTSGGKGRAGSSRQKTAGLTPQERKGLENFRRTVEKLQQKNKPRPGKGQPASSQPSGGAGQRPKGKPSDKPNGDGGSSGAGEGQKSPGDGPAESPGQKPSGRGPDQPPKQRLTRFDQSGRSKDEPQTDGGLLRTVGPQIRRLAEQFRRGTVDPKLLKDLGWSETELRRFVTAWAADDRFNKFVDGPKSTRQTIVRRTDEGPITTSAGAAGGTVGSGTTSSVGQSDKLIENFEARQDRTSPRYRQLIEEYLKAVSEAESDSN